MKLNKGVKPGDADVSTKAEAEAEASASVAQSTTASYVEAAPKLSYEEALERLETVVRNLESGQLTLDESLSLFQSGISLVRLCEQMLDAAESKVEILTRKDNDMVILPFEVGDGD